MFPAEPFHKRDESQYLAASAARRVRYQMGILQDAYTRNVREEEKREKKKKRGKEKTENPIIDNRQRVDNKRSILGCVCEHIIETNGGMQRSFYEQEE